MTKWIRWSGLLGFIAVVTLIALLIILALPWVFKASIEYVGSKVAGAQVNVDDVDVSLVPLGVTITRLQVTDARQPMQNLLEFQQAHADLEFAPLLTGKAISNELSVTGLEFHTPRSVSGEIIKPVISDDEESKPSFKQKVGDALPDADDILARETLRTPAAKAALEAGWEKGQADVDAALAGVPDSQSLKKYEDDIAAITSGRLESVEDFRERKARLDALKKQFSSDRKAVTAARDTIQATRRDLQAKLEALRAAPGEDIAYLSDKYQLSGAGVSNLTGLLLGDDARKWSAEALYWYERVRPYLESEEDELEAEDEKAPRLAGRYVNFPTPDPWPSFLIRNARLTGPFDGGQLIISAVDITNEQQVTRRPTVLTATGSKLQRIGDLDAVLTLDHTGEKGIDTLTVKISDWAMAPLKLGVAGAELASSRVAIDSKAVVTGGQLQASARSVVRDARFTGSGQTLFAKELNQALAGITGFTVNAGAEGKLTAPEVSLGSDLDRQINSALNKRLKAKQDELEARLRKKLNEAVTDNAGQYASQLQELTNMEGSLSQRLERLQSMASTELEDFKAQQEREAQEKLDREKAEAEAKAKAEADARKDELKKKTTDKLKSLF